MTCENKCEDLYNSCALVFDDLTEDQDEEYSHDQNQGRRLESHSSSLYFHDIVA